MIQPASFDDVAAHGVADVFLVGELRPAGYTFVSFPAGEELCDRENNENQRNSEEEDGSRIPEIYGRFSHFERCGFADIYNT